MRPHPVIQSDVLDEDGNLRAADIGITWEGNETFLHGVRVVGSGPPRPAEMGPVMSTPYQPTQEHDRKNTSTTAQPPTPLTVPDTEIQLRRPPQEIRQGYRPAAPIQRFNNKSLNWPVWFRHFQGNRPFADQNRGSAPRHGPVGTTPRSSALAAANSGICSPVAHDRTRRYHSNRRAGISNRTVVNREMVIINRETLPRPGPHPHRSAHASFDPHFIFTN